MKIDFVKTLEASSPYTPGRIYFEESTSLIKVATANNQYRVFGGVRSADYDETTQTLTIQNGNGDEVYLDMSEYVKQDSIIYNGNAKIFYGTCSTAAATTQKDVVCSSFTADDLVKGALIFVTFDNTNSGAVDSLTMSVNGTTAKPLKKEYTAALANLSAKGEILANQTYLFAYDGTNWVCQTLDYNTNTNTYQRVYNSSDNTEYPITTRYATTSGSAYYAEYGRYSTGVTLNPSTNAITASKYIVTGGTASQFLKADGTVDSNSYITSSDIPAMTSDASVAAWGYLKANDVSTKVDKSNAVSSLSLGMNSSTYTITLSGTMADGSTFTVGNPVDLPLETMVVDGSYNSSTKKVSLVLKNGSSVEFSVADLVAGLQSEITSSNKLSADLIQDGTTNKVVTATDKNKWNNLVSNVQADWNATSGLAAILNKPTIPTVNNATLSILKNGTSVGTFTANSSTDTSINIQVNELPTPSTIGVFLTSYWDQETSTCVWRETTHIYDVSNIIYLGYGIPLRANGSYGDTILATGGILKTNFSDWSWINIQYQENNTTVTKNLQDYLDDFILSPDVPSTSGRIAESYYNSTTQRYAWKASDIYSITSPHAILAQPTGGFSVLKNTTDNPRTVYSLGAGGVGGANTTDWSWIRRWSNNVTTTLQDDLNAKQDTLIGSGTGQNIKTVNNNSLVGSGNVSVGTLTGVKFNNVSATINGTVAEITATIPPEVTESTVSGWGFTKNTGTLTEHAAHKLTATNNNATSTSGTITFVESLTGTNTATSGDLTITATRKSVTIPAAANNATITIQKGGTNVDSFTVNASSNKTINIPNELPTITASDNGKILQVVNGAWSLSSVVTVYSGSNSPDNSQGVNGDIYIQT